jgi:acyl carrier protein
MVYCKWAGVMSIQNEIKQFILQNYLFTNDESRLADSDSLMGKGIVDSTGILELIMHVEETYNVKVRDEEMIPDNFDSVANIVAFIERKRAA